EFVPTGSFESVDILIVNTVEAEGLRALARMRTLGADVPVVAAVPRGAPSSSRYAISIDRLTLQLLPILNRVVELELVDPETRPMGVEPANARAPALSPGPAAAPVSPAPGSRAPATTVAGAVSGASRSGPGVPATAPAHAAAAVVSTVAPGVAPAPAAPRSPPQAPPGTAPAAPAVRTPARPGAFPSGSPELPRRRVEGKPAPGPAGAGPAAQARQAPSRPGAGHPGSAGGPPVRDAAPVPPQARRAPPPRVAAQPRSAVGPPVRGAAPVPPRVPQRPSAPRVQVLVVDASPTVRRQLTLAFDRMGVACDAVPSAAAGLERMSAIRYDLVLVDVVMPEVDGYQLTREIRRRHRGIPVIILTSRSSPFDLARGALAGCSS